MQDNKGSITFTVIAGYLLLAALAGFAVWFIYSQVIDYTRMAESNTYNNKKLYLVGEAATNLYEAESLGRQMIQTGEDKHLKPYKAEMDTIKMTLDSLRQTYLDTVLKQEIDSINALLTRKIENIEGLLELRAQEGNQSYYSRVINELQRIDQKFGDPGYEQRFKDLEPHQRRVLIKLLEYSERDNAQQITTQTLDSLVNSVKTVLTELELADRRYRASLREQENILLANEVSLNSQLRNLLSAIEAEEREISLAQVSERQEMVSSTSRIIAIIGAASFLVILIFLFLVMRDVTRSQRYRKQLEKAKQYAESLLKSREQFMATVTHDLRSPLNTVVGYTNLLQNTKLNKSQAHYLNHLKTSSDYILHLVNDLLDLSKLEAGKMSIEELTFNPKNLIEDTVENSIPAQRSDEVVVRVNVSEDLDRPVKSDPFRIKQIITNLVTNACKFTEEGSIIITGLLKKHKEKHFLVITVEDTGIGISEEKKEAIFEEFSQENTSIEKRFGGSGLGLAISKKLTELLQGTIELESEPGEGSTFTIEIPVRLTAGQPIPQPENTPEITPDRGRFKVLLVDDEPAQLSLLGELLKSSGMNLEVSNNGEEALKKLETGKFDLVLTDIQMPKMDGFGLLSRIKESGKYGGIPVIALSGKPDTTPEEYLKLGFSGSLLKPYSPGSLLQMIGDVLKTEFGKNSQPGFPHKTSSQNYSLHEIELFAGGDHEALVTIMEAFIGSTRSNKDALMQEYREGNHEKVAAIAHKMLPMFRQLKVEAVVEQLRILDSSDPLKYEKVTMENLVRQIEELLKELEKEIKG